ncbi:MAG: type III polyketide synthase [Rhodospirillaceae bacterium]|nr:type III polyketide synthase [Rhodospirillaceae bacterium]
MSTIAERGALRLARHGVAPRLLGLATAVPPFVIHQSEVRARAPAWIDRQQADLDRLLPVYVNAGIDTRHSCVPIEWHERPHGWVDRMRLYVDNAVELLAGATRDCLAEAGRGLEEVDWVVCVSSTGIATPTLDALLVERLGMRRDVRRLPIFGLGCAGGVIGLSRAAALSRAGPGSLVLLLVVELCSLTFRAGDRSKSNIIATALFGDGAAAALVGPGGPDAPAVTAGGEHTWPGSLAVMGWTVEEDGLGVLFSRDIPAIVRSDFRAAAEAFLAAQGLSLADIDGLICHPGGTKVVEAIEEAMGYAPGTLAAARDVLRRYGNMSAVTVLFVLQHMRPALGRGRHLMSALGPGFTAGFQLLEL